MEKNTKNVPEKRFSTGAISATIWKNVGVNPKGEPSEFRTISLQRRYKDRTGEWQSTTSLRVNDLPKATLVLQKAYEYIVLKSADAVHTVSDDEADIEIEEIVM